MSGSIFKLFNTQIMFLKEFFEKFNSKKKKSADDNKSMKNHQACKVEGLTPGTLS